MTAEAHLYTVVVCHGEQRDRVLRQDLNHTLLEHMHAHTHQRTRMRTAHAHAHVMYTRAQLVSRRAVWEDPTS
jgi:hypothetical protein